MKKILSLTLALLLLTLYTANAQSKKIDTLRVALSKATEPDTVRLNILRELARNYFVSKPDSSLLFAQEYYGLAVKFKRVRDQASAVNNMANSYITLGDYVKGFSFYFKAMKLDESINYVPGVVTEYSNIGSGYTQKQEYLKALPYLQTGLKKWNAYLQTHKRASHSQKEQKAILLLNISEVFLYTRQIDSADHYLQLSYEDSKKNNFIDMLGNVERDLGEVEVARGHKAAAIQFFRHSIPYSVTIEDAEMLSVTYLSMANLYHKYKQQDSAEYYAQKALDAAAAQRYLQDVYNAENVLYGYYEQYHNLPQAYKYLKLAIATKDSLFSQDKVKQLLSLDFDEKQRQRDIEAARIQVRNNIRMYVLIAGMVILVVLAFIFWRANKARTKAYNLLHKQKEEIDFQKAKVEHTLSELKSTQTQLIQSEKMASLGELTAGIAHEIQNPLNFVNNFAELNKEMIDDMRAELKGGNVKEALTIAGNIQQNEDKISHHGKRADAIVKGMLQHSKTGSGTKEPTNINILADEYMRLSYHGLRAKDKSFNAELVTHFDEKLPKANVIPQDMGRVLLNLFNNAFYAVTQKAKTAGGDYKPEVSVSTSSANGQIVISIKDNGVGISDAIKEKILQPFFTTKPTGEGTGLGLSLSYDILVKGHNGTLDIISKEGEGSEFIVKLPANQS
ncbi:MAG TPA: ATP-binding protein [Mucilaginibacter sp.]|nr:ATP-binding protein [Mucilaginibacter sp.]